MCRLGGGGGVAIGSCSKANCTRQELYRETLSLAEKWGGGRFEKSHFCRSRGLHSLSLVFHHCGCVRFLTRGIPVVVLSVTMPDCLIGNAVWDERLGSIFVLVMYVGNFC